MSAHASPNIITDGLAFMYDTGNGKSYKGEPTTNIVPTPNANARFTTSNGWSTYNTNQYNSNTYFSIGTVSSVSNNIVTLGSVGRTIRSFDVLTPQTTGGGVTAGARYVVKKISSTTFSLHEYNSSQNGSQGYINPDTGFHKVHDAYANDTKITINATNFPTNWWGPPHLPNSGLIKEIVEGGGRVPDTNAMRLHVYRDDGVADGMAYGVYCPVTQGDVITISVWLKRADDRGEGKSIGYSTYFGSGYSGSSTSFGSLKTEWTRYQYTWTASNTLSFYSYWWPNGTTSPYAIDMCDFQVEINGHATPFVVGTRSATEGLLDRTNNSTINLSNVSFDSNAQITLNGTDDYIDLGSDVSISPDNQGWTTEYWFNTNSASTLQHFNSAENDEFNANWLAILSSKLAVWNRSPGYWKYGSTQFSSNTWYQAVFICDAGGTNMRFYVNGEAEGGDHVGNVWTASYSSLDVRYIGKYEYNGGHSRYFNGEINAVKIYDRALTAAEVLQNFNATKDRFGL